MNKETKTVETVEDTKVEETGVAEEVTKEETKTEVEMIPKSEAQKMVDKALAKNLPPKDKMKAFEEWEKNQKTEEEKQAEKDRELETLRQEKLNTQRENALLKKGVSNEELDYVMFKVGKMDGEFEDNLELFLKDNPKYLTKEETKVASTTGVKTNGSEVKEGGVTAILKAKHPELFND